MESKNVVHCALYYPTNQTLAELPMPEVSTQDFGFDFNLALVALELQAYRVRMRSTLTLWNKQCYGSAFFLKPVSYMAKKSPVQS